MKPFLSLINSKVEEVSAVVQRTPERVRGKLTSKASKDFTVGLFMHDQNRKGDNMIAMKHNVPWDEVAGFIKAFMESKNKTEVAREYAAFHGTFSAAEMSKRIRGRAGA
jgi:hypothetical protein